MAVTVQLPPFASALDALRARDPAPQSAIPPFLSWRPQQGGVTMALPPEVVQQQAAPAARPAYVNPGIDSPGLAHAFDPRAIGAPQFGTGGGPDAVIAALMSRAAPVVSRAAAPVARASRAVGSAIQQDDAAAAARDAAQVAQFQQNMASLAQVPGAVARGAGAANNAANAYLGSMFQNTAKASTAGRKELDKDLAEGQYARALGAALRTGAGTAATAVQDLSSPLLGGLSHFIGGLMGNDGAVGKEPAAAAIKAAKVAPAAAAKTASKAAPKAKELTLDDVLAVALSKPMPLSAAQQVVNMMPRQKQLNPTEQAQSMLLGAYRAQLLQAETLPADQKTKVQQEIMQNMRELAHQKTDPYEAINAIMEASAGN